MIYEEYGDLKNPTVIFLHGAMAYKSFMRQRALCDSFHLVFYTLPGHASDNGRDFDCEAAAEEVAGLVHILGKGKVHLVGFSLGSQLALMVAERHPEMLESVVIVSPLIDPTRFDRAKLLISMRLIGFLSKLGLTCRLIACMIGVRGEDFEKFKREQSGQKVRKLSSQILKRLLKSSDLKNIERPQARALIVAGGKESPSFLRSAKRLARLLKNSHLLIYEDAAHNIPYKFYGRFNGDLKLFLENGKQGLH
ncbi:MAG: alpha/beta hydrolase [Clostridiales bacterium]|jgi:pimeloyl-ACP methyl ester carboxylesterase|nr:alpha/beta hydrolase [Clostridiales bacterium]